MATVGTLLGLSDTYFHTECSPGGYALNLSLVPLDYWESFGTATFRRCMLISQSWTIGLEFQIYIVLGILLVTSSRRIAFSLSGTVFLFALFGAFAYKWFIYVYVPPTLFIFLCGSMLATGKRGELAIVAFTWVASVAGLLFAHLYPERMAFLGFEMLLGIAIGIPAVAIASRLKVSAFDGILGSMSYGVYLNHYLLILAVRKLAPAVPGGAIEAALTVPLACFFAWLTYRYVEFPVTLWRRGRRAHTPWRILQPGPATQSHAQARRLAEPRL
ncbi:MAG TPA: acyltransferase family protein [Acetobacteraceae bacterium]|nr:acyltransferase family protein [Acetobacteraceae bacterium]